MKNKKKECKCECHKGYLSTHQPNGDHLKECYKNCNGLKPSPSKLREEILSKLLITFGEHYNCSKDCGKKINEAMGFGDVADDFLSLFKSYALEEYKRWATTHTPTWETENLIGDILGWPEDYRGLYRLNLREEQRKKVKER